ncbi:MAG TPA: FtsX-like permease family protein [Solirubrobacteraceae bacterium]|nr:FtsX-like permease family protein [Solirubrobacteraceae bacterium]
MRRTLTDLWLGARLAATGGADSQLRAALTALGVAFGVALLLFGASVPTMLSAHNARLQARVPEFGTQPAHRARLLLDSFGTNFHGADVSIVALQRTGSHPPLPPGLSRIPRPGTMLVSPALERLLRSRDGGELRDRLHARVVGTIGDAGLTGPAELFAYVGATGLAAHGATAVASFGSHGSGDTNSPLITLLVILMVVALLLPIGVFVATAGRFGSEQRNARLAALRLLGLERAGTARVAAGEALFGSLIGVVAGIVGFVLILRPIVPRTDIAGISVFTRDVHPSVVLAALALILVPVAAVAFALLAMRQVAIEPLGVSRRGRPPRRRLVWRLCTPALGFVLLAGLIGSSDRLSSTGGETEAAAGIVLVLIGVCALLPWLVEAAVVRADGGSVAWLLAVRRLRLDHGTSGRVVGAIGLAVAGAIALQTVFAGAERGRDVTPAALRGLVLVTELKPRGSDPAGSVKRRLGRVAGVRDVIVTASAQRDLPVGIASCATITELTAARGCGADSSYLVNGLGGRYRPDQRIRVNGRTLRIPANATRVNVRPGFSNIDGFLGLAPLLTTPDAAAGLGLRTTMLSVALRVSSAGSDEDQLWDALGELDPLAQVTMVDSAIAPRDLTIVKLRRVLTAGAVAVLLVIGASLLVSVVEQLRERRRVLAVMSAFGTRASTLVWSVLWQTALPVLFGLVLAIGLGAALGAVLMKIVGLPIGFDWGSVVLLAGAGVAVVAGVTGLTLPILLKQIGPDALRAE